MACRFDYSNMTFPKGGFGGYGALLDSLLCGLCEPVIRALRQCRIELGDPSGTFKQGTRPRAGSVFLLVNGEGYFGNELYFASLRRDKNPFKHLIILGTFWNATHREYHDARVTSLWVPFASLSFAEREATPMDLYQRGRSTHGPSRHRRTTTVLYANSVCSRFREEFWDQLNAALSNSSLPVGAAVGGCNGKKHLGRHVPDQKGPARDGGDHRRWEATTAAASRAMFVLGMEHNNRVNHRGYLTEKISSAFLAGAVPLYFGAESVLDVFNGASFISLNTQSPHAAARQVVRMLQRTEEWVELAKKPAVTDAQFAKHFSWHWSVWRTHGDYLRTRIVRFLLGACDASTDSAPFAEAPCKIPTPTVQIPFLGAETGAKGQVGRHRKAASPGLRLLPARKPRPECAMAERRSKAWMRRYRCQGSGF